MTDMVPLAEARNQFSRLIARVETYHERVRVTRNGREVAVLISPDDLANLEEARDALSDPGLMAQLSEAEATDTVVLDHAEARGRWTTTPD